MATFTITLPSNTEVMNGKQITFKAPADCKGITSIIINNDTYELVDAANKSVANVDSYVRGAMLSVILDVDDKRAYLQNGASCLFVASPIEPTENRLLWIDTANSNALKYYNGTSWVLVSAGWAE